jgi:hypothetical protein
MLKRALAVSGVSGKVHYEECGDGHWCPKEYYFKDVELYAAPCKEFIKLAKAIEKYSGKVLGSFDVYYTSVCGKRSSWSDTGNMKYLCYKPKKCQAIIDYIKKNRTSRTHYLSMLTSSFRMVMRLTTSMLSTAKVSGMVIVALSYTSR